VNEIPMTLLGVKRQEIRAERKNGRVNSLQICVPQQIVFQCPNPDGKLKEMYVQRIWIQKITTECWLEILKAVR
jgi:hypothetical protein